MDMPALVKSMEIYGDNKARGIVEINEQEDEYLIIPSREKFTDSKIFPKTKSGFPQQTNSCKNRAISCLLITRSPD